MLAKYHITFTACNVLTGLMPVTLNSLLAMTRTQQDRPQVVRCLLILASVTK